MEVNVRKQVFPKLFSLLRNGCNGSGSVSYPSLVLFVSLIPKQEIGDGVAFYEEFMGSLWRGMCSDQILRSKDDSFSLVKSFLECLLFFFNSSL
jgi:hypothetical protein